MKTAEVIKLASGNEVPSIEELSLLMDKLPSNKLNTLNWDQFSYKPEVTFSIARSDNEIFLKFYIKENHFKAECTEANQEVYEDSCVEFFVSPGDSSAYYNFEFNGIGTCLMGYGSGRQDRTRLDRDIVSMIRRKTSVGEEPIREIHGEISWNITIAIPIGTFIHHEIDFSEGKTFNANFYKCGDKLTVPHYVTWNPVGTSKPDFHRPEFFGLIKFV